jgi:hypothetical protein
MANNVELIRSAVGEEFQSTEFNLQLGAKGIDISWVDGPAAFQVKSVVEECLPFGTGPTCRVFYKREYSEDFVKCVQALNPAATKLGVLAACKVLSARCVHDAQTQ